LNVLYNSTAADGTVAVSRPRIYCVSFEQW
jgi:hypothetical protein